jgi:hypothetical protein
LEQRLREKPDDVNALHILAWIYSTYDRYRYDNAKHVLGLEYAQRAFSIAADRDIYMYEVLGAAMYANDNVAEGDRLYDYAIEHAKDEKQRSDFSGNKQKIRSIYSDSQD